MRTTSRVVTFRQPFLLPGFDAKQPAGSYVVETDEELIDSMSITAYRRVASWIVLPSRPDRPGIVQTLFVDPAELERALASDAAD